MARWLHRLVLVGVIAGVGLIGSGCTSSATPAPASSSGSQQTAAAPTTSVAASAPSSAGASVAASSPAPSSAAASPSVPAGALGDPKPAAQKRYKCASLMSNAEMRSASGYAAAKLFGDDQSSSLSGQTYCQFFTGDAGISIAVSVFTAGAGWDQAFLPLWKLGQVTPGAIHLDGIGDGAIYGATSHTGLALVAGHGVGVVFSDMLSGKLKGVDLQAAVAKILTLVAGRV